MVQHLQFWDYACLSGTMDGRLIEYVDQQHEHFYDPCIVENAKYLAPKVNIDIVQRSAFLKLFTYGPQEL